MSERVFDHRHPGGPPVRLVKRLGGRQSQGLFRERSLRPAGIRRTEFPLCYGPVQDLLFRLTPVEQQEPSSSFNVLGPILRYQQPPEAPSVKPNTVRMKPSRRSMDLQTSTGVKHEKPLPELPEKISGDRSPIHSTFTHLPQPLRERIHLGLPQVPSQAEIIRMAAAPQPRSFSLLCRGYRSDQGLSRLEESNQRLNTFAPPPPPSLWISIFRTRSLPWDRLNMPRKPRIPNALPLIGLPPAEDLPSRRSVVGIQHRQRERSHWLFPRATFDDVRFLARSNQGDQSITHSRETLLLKFPSNISRGRVTIWRSPWTIVPHPPILAWRQAVQRLPKLRLDLPFSGRSAAPPPARARWKRLVVDTYLAPGGARPKLEHRSASPDLPSVLRVSPMITKRLRTLRLDRSFLRQRGSFSDSTPDPQLILPPLPSQPMLSPDWARLRRDDGLVSSPARAHRDLGSRPAEEPGLASHLIPPACRFDAAGDRFVPLAAPAPRRPLPLQRSSRYISGKSPRVSLEPFSVFGKRILAPIVPRLRPLAGPDVSPEVAAPPLPTGLRMRLPTVPFILLTWHGRFAPVDGAFPRRIRSHSSLEPRSEGYRWRPPTLLARRLDGLREFICSLPNDVMGFNTPFRWYFRRIKLLREPLSIPHSKGIPSRFDQPRLAAVLADRLILPEIHTDPPREDGYCPNRLQALDRIVPITRAMRPHLPGVDQQASQLRPLPAPVFHRIRREQIQATLGPFPFGFPEWKLRQSGFTTTVPSVTFIPFFLFTRPHTVKAEIRLNRHARHRSPTNLRFPRRFLFPVRTPFALVPHTLTMRERFSIFDRRALTPYPAPLPKVFLFAMNPDSWIPKADGYRSGAIPPRWARQRASLPYPPAPSAHTDFPPHALSTSTPPAPRVKLKTRVTPKASLNLAHSTLFEDRPFELPASFSAPSTEHLSSLTGISLPPPKIAVYDRLSADDNRPYDQPAVSAGAKINVPGTFPGFKARFRVLRFPWRPETSEVPAPLCQPRDFPDEITIETPDFGGDLRLTEICLPSFQAGAISPTWLGTLHENVRKTSSRWKSVPRMKLETPIMSVPTLETPHPNDLPPTLLHDILDPALIQPTIAGRFPSIGRIIQERIIFPNQASFFVNPAFHGPHPARLPRLFLDNAHFVISGFGSRVRINLRFPQAIGRFAGNRMIAPYSPHHSHVAPVAEPRTRLAPERAATLTGSLSTQFPRITRDLLALQTSVFQGSREIGGPVQPVPGHAQAPWEPRSQATPHRDTVLPFLHGKDIPLERPMPPHLLLQIPSLPSTPLAWKMPFTVTHSAIPARNLRLDQSRVPATAVAARGGNLPEWIDLPSIERSSLPHPEPKNE